MKKKRQKKTLKKGPIADWEVKTMCPQTCIVICKYFSFRTWYECSRIEKVILKYMFMYRKFRRPDSEKAFPSQGRFS